MKNIKDNIKHKVEAKKIEKDVGFAITNIVKKEERVLDLESKKRRGLIVSKNQSISIPAHRSIEV